MLFYRMIVSMDSPSQGYSANWGNQNGCIRGIFESHMKENYNGTQGL